jgi:hypothetical protein
MPVSKDDEDRLSKDLRKVAETMSPDQARYLVDAYYQMQENRIRAAGQVRAQKSSQEPCEVIEWFKTRSENLEKQVRLALDHYSRHNPLGLWARSIVGIGPVISAGLLAHIDLEKAPTTGHIWAFAGLDPTKTWNKGERRPWNASLKTLAWKIGESFVKVSNHPDDVYGKVYAERKKFEIEHTEAGKHAEIAKGILTKRNYNKDTDAYKAYIMGRLPPAHLHARARRYAVKLFLAHYHDVGYRLILKKEPPLPYAIVHMGHAHVIEAPNWPFNPEKGKKDDSD